MKRLALMLAAVCLGAAAVPGGVGADGGPVLPLPLPSLPLPLPLLGAPGTPATAQQIDPAHAGSSSPLPPPLQKRWEVLLGGPANYLYDSEVSYPLIVGGRVFVVVDDSDAYGPDLLALDAATGTVLWRVDLGGTYFWGAATYGAGRVFALNSDGVVRAFEAATGLPLWSRALEDRLLGAAPVASAGRVYIAGRSRVWALDQLTGAVAWSAQAASYSTHAAPAVSSSSVIVTYPYATTAYDPTSGAVLWSHTVPTLETGAGTAVVYGPRVYTRTPGNGEILDAATGAPVGVHPGTKPPAFFGLGGFFLVGSTLEARDLLGLTPRWSFAGDSGVVTPPIVAADHVYVAGGRRVYGLDAASGQLQWTGELPYEVESLNEGSYSGPPVGLAVGEGLLVVPAGPYLVAFEPERHERP